MYSYSIPDKSQLIITSQETALLSQDLINENRGVVWFVEKNRETASSEYSRGDSFGLHKNLSLYNSYRIGRLGAKPELGSIFINWMTDMESSEIRPLILGEGPTEFFYLKSLCDVFKGFTIKPDYPKHTNIKELEAKIDNGVEMDIITFSALLTWTQRMRNQRNHNTLNSKKVFETYMQPKKGLYCEVKFFETHRYTELFFLYYFRYTSRMYNDQDSLLKDLNKCVEYEKTIEFFIKCKGLHSYFER